MPYKSILTEVGSEIDVNWDAYSSFIMENKAVALKQLDIYYTL